MRVHDAGHAPHYILHLSRVLLWLDAYLPRMQLERRGTQDWLRPGGPICLRPNPTPHQLQCSVGGLNRLSVWWHTRRQIGRGRPI
uniref:AraC family transcriptional regulator n=1 Tax=Mesocestoides corti TaxID=53468 RepID=A0A5K3FTT9_MESCO